MNKFHKIVDTAYNEALIGITEELGRKPTEMECLLADAFKYMLHDRAMREYIRVS